MIMAPDQRWSSESLRLIEGSSGLILDLARIVQGSCGLSHPNCKLLLSHYFLYVGYAVWGTRELLLLLPAAVHKELPGNN
jgi:hypothetical protein